jgi:SAM-dependent methyltransferase
MPPFCLTARGQRFPYTSPVSNRRRIRFPIGRIRREWAGLRMLASGPPMSAATIEASSAARLCNICRWTGDAFGGDDHAESNLCPRCLSIARDRFVFFLALNREPGRRRSRVIENSPRLDARYRRYMKRHFAYVSTDFDQSAHTAAIFMDLQKMDLPSDAIDTFITAHVLEHVPDTNVAAHELFRVVRPGGTAVVAVPILQATTSVPTEPEYHGDDTLVFWRFGWDLREVLASTGFDVEIAVTAPFAELLGTGQWDGPAVGEFDLRSMVATPVSASACMNAATATKLGINPPYQFVAFVCRKPLRL